MASPPSRPHPLLFFHGDVSFHEYGTLVPTYTFVTHLWSAFGLKTTKQVVIHVTYSLSTHLQRYHLFSLHTQTLYLLPDLSIIFSRLLPFSYCLLILTTILNSDRSCITGAETLQIACLILSSQEFSDLTCAIERHWNMKWGRWKGKNKVLFFSNSSG